LLANAIEWRLEKVQSETWPQDALDRRVAEAQILVALGLATLVKEGRL
jgi:hypothetical protein